MALISIPKVGCLIGKSLGDYIYPIRFCFIIEIYKFLCQDLQKVTGVNFKKGV